MKRCVLLAMVVAFTLVLAGCPPPKTIVVQNITDPTTTKSPTIAPSQSEELYYRLTAEFVPNPDFHGLSPSNTFCNGNTPFLVGKKYVSVIGINFQCSETSSSDERVFLPIHYVLVDTTQQQQCKTNDSPTTYISPLVLYMNSKRCSASLQHAENYSKDINVANIINAITRVINAVGGSPHTIATMTSPSFIALGNEVNSLINRNIGYDTKITGKNITISDGTGSINEFKISVGVKNKEANDDQSKNIGEIKIRVEPVYSRFKVSINANKAPDLSSYNEIPDVISSNTKENETLRTKVNLTINEIKGDRSANDFNTGLDALERSLGQYGLNKYDRGYALLQAAKASPNYNKPGYKNSSLKKYQYYLVLANAIPPNCTDQVSGTQVTDWDEKEDILEKLRRIYSGSNPSVALRSSGLFADNGSLISNEILAMNDCGISMDALAIKMANLDAKPDGMYCYQSIRGDGDANAKSLFYDEQHGPLSIFFNIKKINSVNQISRITIFPATEDEIDSYKYESESPKCTNLKNAMRQR